MKRESHTEWDSLRTMMVADIDANNPDIVSDVSKLKGKHLKKHVLSHQLIMGTFWWINVNTLPTNNNYIKVDVDDLDNFPVPKIIENYIKENLAFHLE